MKKWEIKDIEAITEEQAREMAVNVKEVKGHTLYFVVFEDSAFGFSMLVFRNGHHIYFANDYALHHHGESEAELYAIYLAKAVTVLFTDSEFGEPLSYYDDYKKKEYYLRNYYGMQEDHISTFCINPSEEYERWFKERTKSMVYDPICFSYYDNKEFVNRHIALYKSLVDARKNTVDNYAYQKAAFLHEMFNHEYGINWEADYSVLSVFGRIEYTEADDELEIYFNQLGFSDLQRKAYKDARKEYFRKAQF